MRALYDVNVLIALFDPRHIQLPHVRVWSEAHYRDGWATCPVAQNGLLRIVSQPKYTNPNPVSALRTRLRESTYSKIRFFFPDGISLAHDAIVDSH